MPGTVHHASHNAVSHQDSRVIYEGGRRSWLLMLWEDIKVPILIIFGLLSITLGTIGYQRYFSWIGEAHNFGRSLYGSLELMEFLGGNLATPIPWELELARWLSPAVVMYAVLLGFAALFKEQIKTLLTRLSHNQVVICGLGEKGYLLAKNFLNSGQKVVVIEKDGHNSYVSAIRAMGIFVIIGDARDEYSLRKAGVANAQSLVALCGDDGTNADIAVKARRIVSKLSNRKLNCLIHINDPRLWVFLRCREFDTGEHDSFRLDIFNIYDQGAGQLLRQYPILPQSDLTGEKAPHLIIIGLGNLGAQIVIHAARLWCPQYTSTRNKLHISVVDLDAQRKIDLLCQDVSLVKEICEWDVHNVNINSSEFHHAEFLQSRRDQNGRVFVYVCVNDESISLSSALLLLEKTQEMDVQILVRMTEDFGLASLLNVDRYFLENLTHLHAFGLMERTCKPSLLNDGSHAALARAIHEEYIREETIKGNTRATNPSMEPWDQLNEKLKEMNRDQADEIGSKLKKIRCSILPWNDYGADQFFLSHEEVELLARDEHERWCRVKHAQGWKYAPLRDEKKKLHPCLLEWEDNRFDETEKEKDRNTVRKIPAYLALAGFQIYRNPTP